MSKEQGKAFDFKLFRRLITFTRPYKGIFFMVAFSAITLSFFSVTRPVLLREIINNYIFSHDQQGLLLFVVILCGVLLLEVISQLVFIYFANWLGQSVIKDIRIKLFKHMLRFKMKYYDNSSIGVLVTRAVSDLERIAEIFSQGFFTIIADLLKMLVVVGVMFFFSWKMTLIVFAILPLMLYATRLFQKSMKVAFIQVRAKVAHLNSFVQERLTGMKIVQLFNREHIEAKKFQSINEEHRNAWLKTVWYNSIFFAVVEILSSVAVGLTVWYGALEGVMSNDPNMLGTVIMFTSLVQMLFRPLRQIADKFNTLQMGMVAANRVFAILDTDSKIGDKETYEATAIEGHISFQDVRFSYVEDEEVLHGISFDVKAGETIAIVGATGAGKSTIINLLNRFYEINSGDILIDGVSIQDYKLESLRSHIAIVLQDVFLFADTIQNNITLKDSKVSLDLIKEAAKQIGVHKFINSLPDDYQYNVKERGTMLSSGQRQLIAFLRAYVSNPSILILDEATSSVDTYSEKLIQKATDKITEGRTSIVIAHRLATVKKADKIIVMDSGTIVEVGTHKELLAKTDGYYRNLYEVQFMSEEVI